MTETATAVYVYGIVPADALTDTDVDAVIFDGVAAVVGAVSVDHPLGAADLREYDRVVASYVERGVPILPMRFGSAVSDREVIVRDILAPKSAEYERALAEFRGLVQFTLRIRYDPDAVLRLVVQEPQIAAAKSMASNRDSGGQAANLRLGQMVVGAISRRRAADAERIRSALIEPCEAVRCTLADDPDHVAEIACLVRTERKPEFIRTAENLAEENSALLRLRLIGPLAPYDFLGEV